jgi:hypothetical protein
MTKVLAQPATYSVPFSIGKNNCGNSGGTDSVYFFNYANSLLTNSGSPKGCKPILKPKAFSITAASVSYNPKDQNIYYVWTDYSIAAPYKSYIWRWNPLTCPGGSGLDTLMSFRFDIGGITFDANGYAWQIEFSGAPPYKAFLRQLDFTNSTINGADTLDLTAGAGGIGDTLYTVGNGDITMTPSGQMYFVFDNKLYTPDYGSYNNPTHHLKATYIDTIRKPTTATALVGLSFADGDLIASYSPGCIYRKIDPVTGDTASLTYTFPGSKGVRSTDMSQINSGIGSSKKLVNVTATGTPGQYDVVYDVYVRNYGNVPVTNLQVTDNLATINGLANVSNVAAVFMSNPSGLTLNAAYNGTSNTNLLVAGQTLPNYPAANNNFTIRITCRMSNIVPGIVYNNSAIATASGFNSTALRDSSTNGANPDLNQNDKPDDLGEGQPTPFIVTLTSTTPPCSILFNVLYNQDFGTGAAGLIATLPASPSASTNFIGSATAPLAVRRFAVTTNAQTGDPSDWISLTDHTGGGNGRMMVLNADAPAHIMYMDTLPVSCPGQQYSLSLWVAFIGNSTYQTTCNAFGGFVYPKLLLRIRDLATNLVITQSQTNDIMITAWQQVGMKWIMPAGYSNVILEVINAGAGGCGNDLALDDIQYGICDPVPTVNVGTGTGCIGAAITFNSTLTDAAVIPGAKDYQWQVASALAGPYTAIAGATSSNYTIPSVAPADTGKFYRVIVAAQGNMGNASCQYISQGVKLSATVSSVAATSATKNKNNICPGISVTLSLAGGSLGTNATWKWYSASCGGTYAGTGTSITVTPAVTTTYYVRAEGDCNLTACQNVTVFISCDIDKDKDGIPDYVESYMPVALQDADGDGVSNAFDTDYAGYIDINNDYINDNFQADGDSDNDGIPNYLDTDFPGRIDSNGDGKDDRFDMDLDGIINMLDLDSDNDGIPDVVEAGGVDANGDGKIDNYTDTDGDGLSQNVDANNTGARISGAGLGVTDLDADGKPNAIDRDSDNDGIPDVVEALGPDTNNDAVIDGFADANGDGLSDAYINATALLKTGADINGDGRADSYPFKNFDNDKRANPYDVDSDMDGITDVNEAGFPDVNADGFIDGAVSADGWNTALHALSSLNLRNTDGRGNPDYLDIDADDDGIPDNIEGQTTAGYILPSYADTDGDGLDNSYDNIAGFGGRGVFVPDLDADGIPDYRDSDTDSDGQPDIMEGNDFNRNGSSMDDVTTLTFLDTDGDGLDNRFDSLNSVTNVRGTSYNMGNGGTTSGDPTPGARAPVQKTFSTQNNRDWRYVGYVLNIQLLQFNGTAQHNVVTLDWNIITSDPLDRFEIERSTDNASFIKAGTVKENMPLGNLLRFAWKEDIAAVNSVFIYYRLKIIAANGQVKYSNVIVVEKEIIQKPSIVFPNPAHLNTHIKYYAAATGEAVIKLIDNTGRTILVMQHNVVKGENNISLDNLAALSEGVYNVIITQQKEQTALKFIIKHR